MFFSTELLSIKSHSWLQHWDLDRKPKSYLGRITSELILSNHVDAQSFWTRLNVSEKSAHTSTKAPKETITHALAEEISLSGEALLSEILLDLLASPEDVRRVSKSVTSKVPSLDSIALPFEADGATLGLDDIIMAPWDDTFTTEEMKHGISRLTEEVSDDLQVPQETRPVPAKKPRLRRSPPLIDKETRLDRAEQFLGGKEGLLPIPTYLQLELVKYLPAEKKKKTSSTPQQEQELGRAIESGIISWDPYDYNIPADETQVQFLQVTTAGYGDGVTASTSILGGLSPMRISSRSLVPSLISSPTAANKLDWQIPSNFIAIRRKSYELLTELQLNSNGATGDSVKLKSLIKGRGVKHDAAICFYKVLDLATIGAIKVYQEHAYGEVLIKKSIEL